MPDVVVLDVVVVRVNGLGQSMVDVSYHERSCCTAFSALSEDVVGVVVKQERGWGCYQRIGIGG